MNTGHLFFGARAPLGSDGQYRPETLEQVVVRWISIWKTAGGVAKVFSNTKNKK